MKKYIFLLFIFLSACVPSAPQVTVTPAPTITSTPLATPTPEPTFTPTPSGLALEDLAAMTDKVEQTVMEVLEDPKYGIVAENYVIESGAAGEVLVKEKETEKVVMVSTEEGIRFDLGFAVDQIAAKSCESTDFKPKSNNGFVTQDMFRDVSNYFYKLREELRYYGGTNFFYYILIDRENQCWGQIGDGWSMIYRNNNREGRKIDLIPISKEEVRKLVENR